MAKHAIKKLITWQHYQRAFDKLDSKTKQIPIKDLTVATIRDYFDNITDVSGEQSANKAYTYLKSAFSWLCSHQYIETHPMVHIRTPNPEADKKAQDNIRIPTDNELKQILHGADALGYPYGDFIKVLVLTGQRRGEVATMQRKELDFKNRVWTIPSHKTKNKKTHQVPLSPQVIKILKSIPNDGVYMFSVTNGEQPITGFTGAKERIRRQSGVYGWTYHTLRHAVATNLSKHLKINDVIISAILNHSTVQLRGMTSRYNHHDLLPERAKALNQYANWLDNLMDGVNVVKNKRVAVGR